MSQRMPGGLQGWFLYWHTKRAAPYCRSPFVNIVRLAFQRTDTMTDFLVHDITWQALRTPPSLSVTNVWKVSPSADCASAGSRRSITAVPKGLSGAHRHQAAKTPLDIPKARLGAVRCHGAHLMYWVLPPRLPRGGQQPCAQAPEDA